MAEQWNQPSLHDMYLIQLAWAVFQSQSTKKIDFDKKFLKGMTLKFGEDKPKPVDPNSPIKPLTEEDIIRIRTALAKARWEGKLQ